MARDEQRTGAQFADLEDKSGRKLARRAMILFGWILDTVDTTAFTLADIREAFGSFRGPTEPVGSAALLEPKEKHLRFLVRKGLLLFDEELQTYSVRGESDILNEFGIDEETRERENRDPLWDMDDPDRFPGIRMRRVRNE